MILYQDKIKYILISVAVVVLAMIGIIAWRLNREGIQKNAEPVPIVETKTEVEKKPLPEEIKSISVPQENKETGDNTGNNINTSAKKVPVEVINSLSVPASNNNTPSKVDQKTLDSLSVPAK